MSVTRAEERLTAVLLVELLEVMAEDEGDEVGGRSRTGSRLAEEKEAEFPAVGLELRTAS